MIMSTSISLRKIAVAGGALVCSLCMPALALEAPTPCIGTAPYDDLDFMLGEWDIIVNGNAVAWITLEKDGRNCLIREQYGVPVDGQAGAGMDYWDSQAKIWRRILVTSVGTVETFEGFRSGDKFIWNGREARINGATILERVEIWREGDTVRNDIYQSLDGGVTWLLAGSETRIKRAAEN